MYICNCFALIFFSSLSLCFLFVLIMKIYVVYFVCVRMKFYFGIILNNKHNSMQPRSFYSNFTNNTKKKENNVVYLIVRLCFASNCNLKIIKHFFFRCCSEFVRLDVVVILPVFKHIRE